MVSSVKNKKKKKIEVEVEVIELTLTRPEALLLRALLGTPGKGLSTSILRSSLYMELYNNTSNADLDTMRSLIKTAPSSIDDIDSVLQRL